MFYLLEDNRIVDSLSIREDLDLPFEVDFYVQKDEIVLTIDHSYFEHISIIKKAESVFDLIEKGDLITEKRIWCNEEIYVIANVWSKEDKLIHCFHSTLFDNDVYAIYKLDANGNYIKVWEKKENEKED